MGSFWSRASSAMDRTLSAVRSSTRGTATTVLIGAAIIIVLGMAWMSGGSLSSYRVPHTARCADGNDILNPSTQMCQVNNAWALSFLRGQGWSTCAADLPGMAVLQRHHDSTGKFWYPYNRAAEVREVYRSCAPVCAAQEDAYHSQLQMCIVRYPAARMWLAGYGQSCSKSSEGSGFISKAGAGSSRSLVQQFVYAPANARQVEQFYKTCRSTCALGDEIMADGKHCQVKDVDAMRFFHEGNQHCVSSGPGVSSISNTKDGGYFYPLRLGPIVQAWYLTCKRKGGMLANSGSESSGDPGGSGRMGLGRDMAGGMGEKQNPPRHGVQILFPYPKGADKMSITLCNFADRTYYYKGGKRGSEKVALPSVGVGETCMSIPLDQACKDEVCWERGAVAPCETRSCFLNSAKAVTAGISVVSSGQGSAVCTVICTAPKAECKTMTTVYIAPAHCSYVQVLPSAVDLVEFPAPYNNMPKVVFPYPTKWKPGPESSTRKLSPTTISICNWGYEDYWFSTGDSTDEAWKHGAGHVLVKPIGRGGEGCVVVNAEELSWKRGYIAPCPSGESSCARILAQEVHAGVNVVNPAEAGQALCNVECASDSSVCKTTTVILISPVKCDKVHVATM